MSDVGKNMGLPQSVPRVSVIVPCYNYAHFLDETLASVERQTFQDWECLIVDDGSTDNTQAVVKTWAGRDARFLYLHQPHHGLCAARNTGLKNARGDWLQFLDADDLISQHKLETQLSLSREYSRPDIICGRFVFMAHDGASFWQWSQVRSRIETDDAFGDLLASCEKGLMIAVHALLFRRECFTRWGNWDETLGTHEDWEILLRFSLRGARFLCHDDVVAAYRKHHHSVASDATKMRQGFLRVMLQMLESPHVARRYKPLIVFRFLEDCFKSIVLKLQKRRLDLKAVYFDPNNSSSYRAWLLLAFVIAFPLLAMLKIADMLRVRWQARQGGYQRVDATDFR